MSEAAKFNQYARFDDNGTVVSTHEFRVGRALPYDNLVDFTDLFPCDVTAPAVKTKLAQRLVIVKAETEERKRKEGTKGDVTPATP